MTKIAPIALTIGEPGGIGPELSLKVWLRRHDDGLAPFCVLAPLGILENACREPVSYTHLTLPTTPYV